MANFRDIYYACTISIWISGQLGVSINNALQAAYLDVTALARVASAANARVTSDMIHARSTIDTRWRLALVVLVFTVLAGEPCYTTEVSLRISRILTNLICLTTKEYVGRPCIVTVGFFPAQSLHQKVGTPPSERLRPPPSRSLSSYNSNDTSRWT